MSDLLLARVREIMVVLLAGSIVLSFMDAVRKDRRIALASLWLLAGAWLILTLSLARHVSVMVRFPVLSLFEGVYAFSWLLLSAGLALHFRKRFEFLPMLMSAIAFVCLSLSVFGAQGGAEDAVGVQLRSELLFIHIGFAILSYGAFALSFVFSCLYLWIYRTLKRKKWTPQWGRLPSLKEAENGMAYSVYAGLPLLVISIALGWQWAHVALPHFSALDSKIVGSVLLAAAYGAILYAQESRRLDTARLAQAHLFAFLLLLINFFINGKFSHFHIWI